MTATTQRSRPGLLHRAGWLLVLCTFAMTCLPMSSVSATDTICVALVVDFSPLGGNVDSGCTRVPSGATGYDVLHAGGHSYEVCSNGVIGTIDGQPAIGCQVKDNNHFWGYWHRKPGSRTWTFSSYGAGFYHPGEGSTEGWVWEDGTTSPPADVAYPVGCHSPPRSPSPTPAATKQPSPSTSHSAAPTSTRTSGSTSRATHLVASATATPKTRERSRTTAIASSPAAPTPTPSSTAAVAAGSTTQGGRTTMPTAAGSSGRNQAAPVIVGVAAAAVLGVGAWWRFRRTGPL